MNFLKKGKEKANHCVFAVWTMSGEFQGWQKDKKLQGALGKVIQKASWGAISPFVARDVFCQFMSIGIVFFPGWKSGWTFTEMKKDHSLAILTPARQRWPWRWLREESRLGPLSWQYVNPSVASLSVDSLSPLRPSLDHTSKWRNGDWDDKLAKNFWLLEKPLVVSIRKKVIAGKFTGEINPIKWKVNTPWGRQGLGQSSVLK